MTDIRVRVGQVWRDKDPRSPSEVVVLHVPPPYSNGYVRIQRPSRKTTVRYNAFVSRFAFVREGQ